jgi:hypothetical protein
VSNKPPTITSPVDLTTSPAPVDLVVPVIGTGIPNVPLQIDDQGLFGVTALPTSLPVSASGVISGSITLSHGTLAKPNPGWHKLLFSQGGGAAAPPVFISVGINPPTVTFPRTGAKIDCSPGAPHFPGQFTATGSVPYSEAQFGPLRVAEETGRQRLAFVDDAGTSISQTQSQDGSFAFQARVILSPGRHLLYFFQANNPPQGVNQDEYFRAFATIANTPTSRIVVNVPPPRIPIPPGLAGVVNTRGFANNPVLALVPPTNGTPIFAVGIGPCGSNAATLNQTPSPFCAIANADVNLRIGTRLFTSRADGDGAWKIAAPVPAGWTTASFSQVVDSPVGGAWQEGCPSNDLELGGATPGGPTITVPPDATIDATSPAGAVFNYDVSATTSSGDPAPVECTPPSGSTFPLGPTAVVCTAKDPATGAIGLETFEVTVRDGPPIITTPGNISVEATSAAGALVSYDATAVDVVSGPVPITCTPASPVQVGVDATTEVSCMASNASGAIATAMFAISVVDTTPPTLCPIADIVTGTNAGAGAFVSFTTCATDLVDGTDPVVCDHAPSGSFFAVGTTVVTCSATDAHGHTATESFTVTVGDTTPPVLTVPADITVTATSRLGAKVTYSATATDNVDPHPTVSCVPPSGAQFPLGRTTVNCTATDASGNHSSGSFHVTVVVSWSGFLFPIANDGSTRWEHNIPLPVRFALTGASAGIPNLSARLFVARLDASGHPGAEIPAVKIPPINSGYFDFIPIINQYLFVMDTRPQGIGPWQLRVDLGDGVAHAVRVTFTP